MYYIKTPPRFERRFGSDQPLAGHYSRELAAHRLVILSGMAETAAISSLDIRRSSAAAHGFRQNCLLMNEIGAALCNRQ